MATYPVPPSFEKPLVYNVTLDNQPYTLTVYYQAFGKRFYFLISDNIGNNVLNMALIPDVGNKDLLDYYFTTSSMTYSDEDQIIEILP